MLGMVAMAMAALTLGVMVALPSHLETASTWAGAGTADPHVDESSIAAPRTPRRSAPT